MKKMVLVLALTLGLVGFIGIGVAEAAHVAVSWTTNGVISISDPRMYQVSVFSSGKQEGGSKPPIAGGGIVILDITDRTYSQLEYLVENFGGDPEGGKRYELRFNAGSDWMRVQLYKRGFITTTWARIRGSIWDNQLGKSLAGVVSRYADSDSRARDNCISNCDYEACQAAYVSIYLEQSNEAGFCTCEEYEGRIFCHKNNRYTYSDVLDH